MHSSEGYAYIHKPMTESSIHTARTEVCDS